MILEERIREWQRNIIDKYCQACLNHCCNPGKYRIEIDSYSLPLFREKGVPLIHKKELKKSSIARWKKIKIARLLLSNGSEVQKPSVVEISKGLLQNKYYLYADSCPFYQEGEGCEIHENKNRPSDCKDYPIVFLEQNSSLGDVLDVKIMKSCEIFNKEEIKSELVKKFPAVKILG